ncbi:MAG: outer membrane protein assembly factor BamA [Deltaproteobacteria bacterium RBG_13_49_15]|nr:MAG: outer membrane protein assembly factor BamA [Deltaproteobacteria bacterium RBG_13_49_15]
MPEDAAGLPDVDSARETAVVRELGLRNGADQVVWGSLTQIGKKFSIDVKTMDPAAEEPPKVLVVKGEGIENLLGAVKKLGDDLTLTIFKRDKITEVTVSGNKRIETDAIKRIFQTAPGDVYSAKKLSEDLKKIYQMGYFEDVRVETQEGPGGKIVVFKVQEKPTIRKIQFKGNRKFNEKELMENLDIRTGAILNIFRLRNNLKRIEDLYKGKNYHTVQVSYEIEDLKNNQADVQFIIQEGEKIKIKTIRFEGNTVFTNNELKKVIKTSEKGLFSFITSSGELDKEKLTQDVAGLSAFYQNNGYLYAKVGEPNVEYAGEWIYVSFKIYEGPRFKVGKVAILGDVILSEDEMKKQLKIDQEPFFSREIVRNDVLSLTDLYTDQGYAYAEISPKIEEDSKNLVVDITYSIRKGKQVAFEKILISGNKKTRDKVIRRELQVYEREIYSGQLLKRSIRNLFRLEYFDDVKVQTLPGSSDETMVLKIDVTERSTGAFSVGAGYSSEDDLFAMASITQRNLFGRGQLATLEAHVGGTSDRYNISFTEPWLFDIPLSSGFDLYRWRKDYDTYDKDSAGGVLRSSYPVYRDTRFYLSYTYEIVNIENIEEDAPSSLKELEGQNIQSSVAASLRYDSRNRLFNTTEGSDHLIGVEYAGLGGDIGFTKYTGKLSRYFPLFKGTVGFLHLKGGYVRENQDGKLPDYERFYLGGINSLRGFKWRTVSPVDEEGNLIGGDKFIQLNAEYQIPLFKEAGIMGLLFFDAGNAYNNNENIDLGNTRETAGFGFRWYSPVGPIRLEYGFILDRREDEGSGRWEFSISTGF